VSEKPYSFEDPGKKIESVVSKSVKIKS